MLKVVGYIRVSTDEQAKEGVSLDAQREKLAAYAALYDLELIEIVEDAGVSAKSLKRPGLERALRILSDGTAAGLLITKLDRLSRSVGDWNRMIDAYFGEKAGRQLFSVTDSIDTRTAAGRLVLNVLMSVAQWERETTAERTRDSLSHKRRKGEKLGGRVPFGFNVADSRDPAAPVTLVQNAAEQKIIAEMARLRAMRLSYRKIADALNSRGIPAKSGGRWIHTAVKAVLQRAA